VSEHFNQLTPAEAERLAMLSEEAAEIVHAVGKILRHGYDSCNPNMPMRESVDNRAALRREIDDLFAVVRAMERAGDFGDAIWQRKLRYTHHQEKRT
jgi:hypothetical protein